MSIDLQDLFDQAGHEAPAPSFDGDLVVRRGRRLRARRRAVAGTTTLFGVGVVALGSFAAAGALPSGGHDTVEAGPAAAGPAAAPSSGHGDTPRAALRKVSLPDPAPGFPVRRGDDAVARQMEMGPGRTYWANTYLLAVSPDRVTTSADGQTSGVPTGPEATVLVGDFPAATAGPDGKVEGHDVVASPTVAGVTGLVTTYREKGTPVRTLYFSSGDLSVEVIGFDGVTTGQLVDLGDALTGLE